MRRSFTLLFLLPAFGLYRAAAHMPACAPVPQEQRSPADTTITYSIEGISSEGAEATARYVKGKIKSCIVKVYGENGQSRIRYVFSKNNITVTEQQYTYKGGLESVQHKADMQLKKTIHYTTDNNGTPLTAADKDRLDIFTELADAVPFELP